jgi:hypothetical protein
MNRDLTRLMIAVGQSDSPPASSVIETYAGMCQDARAALARWSDLRANDLAKLNALLIRDLLAPLKVPGHAPTELDCGN